MIASFVEAVEKIIDLKPDLCVHAGDIFHTVRPLNSIMAVAAEQLHRLSAVAGIPTVIIAGNHDAPKQPHIGAALSVFRQIDNLFVAAEGELRVWDLAGARVFALPHCLTNNDMATQLERLQEWEKGETNILIAHGVAAGMPEFSMAEIGELELPREILDEFDYCALGHYHNHCKVAKTAWYAGSTERLSQSERDSVKGFVTVGTDPLQVELVPVATRAMVDIGAVDASGKVGNDLIKTITDAVRKVEPSEKIVRVDVTGVTNESLKTIPASQLAELKAEAFSLNIRFNRDDKPTELPKVGKASIGRLDHSFLQFLEKSEIPEGIERDDLKRLAEEYLSDQE